MKLVMTLVVRDEEDILAAQLHYHRAQGVAFFLVLDHRSIDGTREILQDYESRGWLQWFAIDSLQRDQGRWVTALAQKAFQEHQADWVINNDADEFWWCEKGTVHNYLAKIPTAYRLVYAPRINFWAPNTTQSSVPFWEQQVLAQKNPVNFLDEPLSGKICHRGEPDIVVHHGNHSVEPMQAEDIAPASTGNDLHILHFPLRSYPQFEQKVRNWVDYQQGQAILIRAVFNGSTARLLSPLARAKPPGESGPHPPILRFYEKIKHELTNH